MTTLFDITINDYKLSLAQQRWVVEHALTVVRAQKNAALVAAFESAAGIVDAALAQEDQYLFERGVRPDGHDAMDLDRRIDALVGVVYTRLDGLAGLDDLMPHTRAAAELLKLLFPKGLRGHTHIAHKDASIKNARLVSVVRDPAWADVTGALALGPIADRIAELNTQFDRILHPERTLSGDDMEAIRTRALDATLRAFFLAAATYDPADPAQVAQREDVLRPLVTMQRERSITFKRQRNGTTTRPDEVIPEASDAVEETGAVADAETDAAVVVPMTPVTSSNGASDDEVLPAELGETPVGDDVVEACAEEAFVTPPDGAGEASEAVGEEVPTDGAGEVAAAAK